MFKAHRLLYHSTLGLRVIKKKQSETGREKDGEMPFSGHAHSLSARKRNLAF